MGHGHDDTDRGDAARRADLRRIAGQHADAVWGDGAGSPRARRAPLSLEAGPKARIGAGLRGLSVDARRRGEHVPRGTTVPGTGRYVLAAMLLFALAAAAAAAMLIWLVQG